MRARWEHGGRAGRLSHDGHGQARRLSHRTAIAVPNRLATEGFFHGQLTRKTGGHRGGALVGAGLEAQLVDRGHELAHLEFVDVA